MMDRTLLCLALLSVNGVAAASGFLLGVDYSEWLTPNVRQIATDRSGALYILSDPSISTASPPSSVTKLSADGKTILWRNDLGFAVYTMAVDPNGGVYVAPVSLPGDPTLFVAKLNAGGAGVAWKAQAGFLLPMGKPPLLAADSSGRVYIAGSNDLQNSESPVVRLNAAGSAVEYAAHVAGIATSLAVDAAGAAFVAGASTSGALFLKRLAPDGSAGFSSVVPQPGTASPVVAVNTNGEVVVYASGALLRFDSAGVITLSTMIAAGIYVTFPRLALDTDGNAYVVGSAEAMRPVRNNTATCGSELLAVVAPDGSLLQSTYLPGGQTGGTALIATGPNSTVFVADSAATFVPMYAGPFPPSGTARAEFLLHLSPDANAQAFPLACLGNAASFGKGEIAPGEIVALFGTGLGPEQGLQTQATPQTPFPTRAANVEVTFDGKPAPLLWVQDTQVNVVVPWSLTPGRTTQICVTHNDVKTNCLTWPVVEAAPAVFTVDGVHAAALNQDGSINTAENPAVPGSIIAVFAIGLGAIAPAQADGTLVGFPLPNSVLPVHAEAKVLGPAGKFFPIVAFDVTYAGPAPYLVAGISQINFKVINYSGDIYLTLPMTQTPAFQVYLAGH
jgi:uncharacterized protein (TIGR03437 family)